MCVKTSPALSVHLPCLCWLGTECLEFQGTMLPLKWRQGTSREPVGLGARWGGGMRGLEGKGGGGSQRSHQMSVPVSPKWQEMSGVKNFCRARMLNLVNVFMVLIVGSPVS
jgi:hypothetical protein